MHSQNETTDSGEMMTPDLRLEMSLKNNVLWHAIHDNYPSIQAFCRAHPALGKAASDICTLLNFKESPFKRDGSFRAVCLRIQEATRIAAEILFDEELYRNIRKPKKVLEIDSFTALPDAIRREIRRLPAPVETVDIPLSTEKLHRDIDEALATLDQREREIIRMRTGIGEPGGQSRTLEQAGAVFGIKKEFTRQIEARALRKLRQASRASLLRKYVDGE